MSQDSGVYTCTASTQQQLEQSQLQLRVQSKFFSSELHLGLTDILQVLRLLKKTELAKFCSSSKQPAEVATSTSRRFHSVLLTITVVFPADLRITTAPNNIQVLEGSTAVLPCVVSGDNVSIGWSRYTTPHNTFSGYKVLSLDVGDFKVELKGGEANIKNIMELSGQH